MIFFFTVTGRRGPALLPQRKENPQWNEYSSQHQHKLSRGSGTDKKKVKRRHLIVTMDVGSVGSVSASIPGLTEGSQKVLDKNPKMKNHTTLIFFYIYINWVFC